MTKVFLSSLMIASASLMLAGCNTASEQFDFSKKAPDEFAVVTRAPLEMPPTVGNLPPPRPGMPRPQEKSPDIMARQSVLGDTENPAQPRTDLTQGESILLQKTGATSASPAIRATVDKETAEIAEKESPGIDKLKKMIGQNVEPPAKVVDPVAEVERLRKNKAAGKPVTDGKTLSRED